VRPRPFRTIGDESGRLAIALILGALAATSTTSVGCAVGDGLDSALDQAEDAAGSQPNDAASVNDVSDTFARDHADGPLVPDAVPGGREAGSDAPTDGGAGAYPEAAPEAFADDGTDTGGQGASADATDAVPDATDDATDDAADDAADGTTSDALEAGDDAQLSDASPDAGIDAAAPDANLDAVAEGDTDARTDAGLEGGPDAAVDAATDSGCSGAPQITILTPASGATITVVNHDSSTFTFTFSAHVDFCATIHSVTFDYSGPEGRVPGQEMTFSSYANPFAQDTQVGGSASLESQNEGQSVSNWTFSVTATDGNHLTTVATEPFTLLVRH
jgi:hypothetical protein